MKILAIETTSSAASAAIMDEEKLLGEYVSNTSLTHLQKLMPMVDQLLKSCELEINEVTCIAVSEGPGSFTGTRIGISTARALAQALNIKIIAVPTLKAMAYNVACTDALVCPVLDARREQVYSGAYRFNGEECQEIIPAGAYGIQEILDKVQEFDKILFLGDGIKVYKTVITARLGDRACFAPSHLVLQRASSVALLGLKLYEMNEATTYDQIEPAYLRKPEAERKLENKC